ncbi:PKD-like family lipoprotein [Flavivirga spongiicola]|uniref:PKD-like family lipoprotein n=1 Tax=Flavivirga spongiicola TaxID=421621 RepID=A0ABU7XSD4_9FLAO|nr:PKD-like family lipoprotein [Flavivirga sp. MEBiC05379]MDO5977849.1 PKD-like family lipoprotein [Flavivirga sp. MEBiC05379]
MKKYIKIQLMLALLITVVLSSCLEDEGNYDYKDINEVVFEGIQDEYALLRFDDFKISPEVTFTQGSGSQNDYSYRWVAVKIKASSIDEDEVTELATTKDLDIKLELLPGDYTIHYFITDNSTNIEWQSKATLRVANAIFEGWLLLSSVGSESRLDMIPFIDEDFLAPKQDVLSFVGSELTLQGSPGFVYFNRSAKPFEGIYVSTSGNGTTKLEPDTFGWNKAYNLSQEFDTTQPEDLEADNMVATNGGQSYVVKDGNIYLHYRIWQLNYSTPINRIGGVNFEASSMIGKGSGFFSTILYDNTNKRFVQTQNGTTNVISSVGTLFDYTTGKDLVYMVGNDYNALFDDSIFAILNDPNDGKNYLALFNSRDFVQSYYGEILATDFDQATGYAISPDFGYLFYAVGGKVYQYDFSLGTTKLMLDKGTEEITLIKFHDIVTYWKTEYSEINKKLIVCSYDPSGTEGSNGTMELYTVPPVNGQIVLEESYTGFGKIESITYRERF